jgi:hypothetical protein
LYNIFHKSDILYLSGKGLLWLSSENKSKGKFVTGELKAGKSSCGMTLWRYDVMALWRYGVMVGGIIYIKQGFCCWRVLFVWTVTQTVEATSLYIKLSR